MELDLFVVNEKVIAKEPIVKHFPAQDFEIICDSHPLCVCGVCLNTI